MQGLESHRKESGLYFKTNEVSWRVLHKGKDCLKSTPPVFQVPAAQKIQHAKVAYSATLHIPSPTPSDFTS